MKIQYANIPTELMEIPQWVVWRYETRNDKPAKVPYSAYGTEKTGKHERAKTNDPTTWTDFSTAYEAYWSDERWAGIGFVFSKNDPYCGLDLDNCRDPQTGAFEPWAEKIIKRCQQIGAYCEISPSQKGVKIFLKGSLPSGKQKGDLQIFSSKRFFTKTGWQLKDG